MTNTSISKKTKGKQLDLRDYIFKRKKSQDTSNSLPTDTNSSGSNANNIPPEEDELLYDVELLPHDPGKRINITDYPPNKRNFVRRSYILKKHCQPKDHNFPARELGGPRKFKHVWFEKWDWLEYSIEKDATFCFICYLFKNEVANVGGYAFVTGGFRSWNKPDRFIRHVGGLKSAHNLSYDKYVNLRDGKKKSINVAFGHANELIQSEYWSRLIISISCLRFLLRQGLAFRGHREDEESLNRGNFLELLKWLSSQFEYVASVTFKSAPGNCQLTSPLIQKHIISCCAKQITKRIIKDIGDDYFAILADESSDVSQKEQLALCLRYVERKTGKIIERFLGLAHVSDTTSVSLKNAIMSILVEYSLSPSKIRWKGYDGASNMKGEINGLKALFISENPSAYYVYCFAHQLQLTLVAVAKRNNDCAWLFDTLATLLNVVWVSCKRREMIRELQAKKDSEALA